MTVVKRTWTSVRATPTGVMSAYDFIDIDDDGAVVILKHTFEEPRQGVNPGSRAQLPGGELQCSR